MVESLLRRCGNDSFGPFVTQLDTCRNGSDFTLLFQESIFSILPSALLLCVLPLRLSSLRKRPDVIKASRLKTIKLVALSTLCLLKLALIVLWAQSGYAEWRTRTTLASAILDLAATIAVALLSPLEHSKTLRPSFLIGTFLFVTTVLDIIRLRTLQMLPQPTVAPDVFTVAFAIRCLLVFLEELPKASSAQRAAKPEQTSGLYSMSSLLWIWPVIVKGSHINLTVEDLNPLHETMESGPVDARIEPRWNTSRKDRASALIYVVFRALWIAILLPIVPALIEIGFNVAQPFLISACINFVQDESAPDSDGIALMFGLVIAYLGTAVSGLWSYVFTFRLYYTLTAALMNMIYKANLDLTQLSDSDEQTTSPESLISTDVERFADCVITMVSAMPHVVQLGVAIYLLATRLGPVCIFPVLTSLAVAAGSTAVANMSRPLRRVYMEAVQRRIKMTTGVLGSLRGIKMLGLTSLITDSVQEKRETELQACRRWRRVALVNMILRWSANYLAPVVTFIGYGLLAKFGYAQMPNAALIFSSVALLSLMGLPTSMIILATQDAVTLVEIAGRIQKHLTRARLHDFRDILSGHPYTDEVADSSLARDKAVVELREVDAGWGTDKVVIRGVSLQMQSGTLTMIIGPTGCGKSTLLQTLLGACALYKGSVTLATDNVAYCHQTAFLTNQTIRQNILADRDFDKDWYEACLHACSLKADLRDFPRGDLSLVGSKGIALSGGQKQRVTLARAAYARRKLVILDDCISGLDAETQSDCFHRLLGDDGLLRRAGMTTILVTHSVQWLQYSDQVIAMDEGGGISQSGTFDTLASIPGYVRDLKLGKIEAPSPKKDSDQVLTTESNDLIETIKKLDEEATETPLQGRRDSSALLYFIDTMGRYKFLLFLAVMGVQSFASSLPSLWLSWWVNANERHPGADFGLWLGGYFAIGMSPLVLLAIAFGYYLIKLIPDSGSVLHRTVLQIVMRAPMTFISSVDSGSLLNRFSQDMTELDQELPSELIMTITTVGGLLSKGVLISVSSGYIALAFPLLAIAVYYLGNFYLHTSRQLRLLSIEVKAPLLAHLTESGEGASTIRAFGWERFFTERNFSLVDRSLTPNYQVTMVKIWLITVMQAIVALMSLILMGITISLRHSVSSSLLGVSLVSLLGFSNSLQGFVLTWTGLETALASVVRVRRFVRDTPAEPNGDPSAAALDWPVEPSITLKGVTAAYKSSGPNVIERVDLNINAGERIAICGRTGSGKSTVMGLLLRLLDPSEGAISIGGQDVSQLPPETVRSRLNALPQEPWFLPATFGSVRENLDPRGEGEGAAPAAELEAALARVGLADQIAAMGGLDASFNATHLSAGQKQLFCLARATLMHTGKILLLDEATSNVDIQTEQTMMSLLRTEFAGWTVVAVVHRLQSIADFDKVLVLERGRVVEFGSPQALLADDGSAFAKLYRHGAS